MTQNEIEAGIARNNARAMDPAGWRLRWIYLPIIPTGSFVSEQFQIPPAAALYRLQYFLVWWPVGPGAFRPLFAEIMDDRGQKHVFVQSGPELGQGAKLSLFTTPNVDPNSTLAGDQAAYMGMMPLNIDFPGRCTVTINLRGATATPDPTEIAILLAGHQKNQVG